MAAAAATTTTAASADAVVDNGGERNPEVVDGFMPSSWCVLRNSQKSYRGLHVV